MKIFFTILLVIFLSVLVCAEYKELSELKKFSHRAINGYAKRLSNVNPKFEGVVNFGKSLKLIKIDKKINVNKFTVESKDYWRAVLEMARTDPSVLFAHAYIYASRGETAYAEAYFLLGSLTMDDDFQDELNGYNEFKKKLSNRVEREMQIGFQYHDKGEYDKALAKYDEIISQYTNSAWAFYEKGFSYLMKGVVPPQTKNKKEQMYAACRQRDPFYWKAYQGSDKKVNKNLLVLLEKISPFVSGEKRDVKALNAFAEGCEEIEFYPLAAHAHWILASIDHENIDCHIKKFLDFLPKCGCKETDFFRKVFKFDENGKLKSQKKK